VQPGDVALAISGSGNSKNVLNALRVAREARATTVGISGFPRRRNETSVRHLRRRPI